MGQLYDRSCALAFYELCVEAVPETSNADHAHTEQYASDRFRITIELAGEEFYADSCICCNTMQFHITDLYMVPA